MAILENEGWCPTCASRTAFRAEEPWLREHYRICRHIHDACGLFTHVVQIDHPGRGIRGELLDVLVTGKPGPGQVPVFED